MTTVKLTTRNGKNEVEVPKYFTYAMHTDAFPYEVIEAISEKTVVVRAMKSTLDPEWKPEMHVGGFAAHCSNSRSQKWISESDPNGGTFQIRRKKKPRTVRKFNNELNKFVEHEEYEWTCKGLRFKSSENPYRYHDYNF